MKCALKEVKFIRYEMCSKRSQVYKIWNVL